MANGKRQTDVEPPRVTRATSTAALHVLTGTFESVTRRARPYRGAYFFAAVNGVIALMAAVKGEVLPTAIFALASLVLVLGERLRRRHLSPSEQQDMDNIHRGIDWVTRMSMLLALTACGLVVATIGLVLGEPISRLSSGIMLAGVGCAGGLIWFLLRKVPD